MAHFFSSPTAAFLGNFYCTFILPKTYFYEICNNDGKEFHLQLAFSSKNIPDDLRFKCDQIADSSSSRNRKTNWLWYTAFTTRRVKVKDDEELVEEKIFEHLDKLFADLMSNEATIIANITSKEQNGLHEGQASIQ